jgi:AraC-like DNA-binding protein
MMAISRASTLTSFGDEAPSGIIPKSQLREHLVRCPIVPVFLRALAARSARSAARLVAKHRLPVDACSRSDLTLAISRIEDLCDDIAAELGDPFAGLHIATALGRSAYSLVELVFRAASSGRDALEQLIRFGAVIDNSVELSYEETKTTVIIKASVPEAHHGVGRHANELIVGLFVRIARELAGDACEIERVFLAHGEPEDKREHERVLGTSALVFGVDHCGIEIKRSTLDVACKAPALREQHAPAVPGEGGELLARVRDSIRCALADGDPAAPKVARALGMSTRTLHRRLAQHGTVYRAIVDEVRAELARVYLDEHSRTLVEVAFLLGYSDLRALIRAHKRWTGCTPGEMRRHAMLGS